MLNFGKRVLQTVVGAAGYTLRRDPAKTLLGVAHLPIRTVIDIGANSGQFARRALTMFPRATIHCFEPSPAPFRELSAWAATQRGSVIADQRALGDTVGRAEFNSHEKHSPSSSFLETTEAHDEQYPLTRDRRIVDVRVTTLDDVAREHGRPFTPEILVKLDVQGFEDRVIRGARETLERARVCICEACIVPLYQRQPRFLELASTLDALGLQYVGNLHQECKPDGSVIYIDAVFLRR